uniref:Uncharacterized protein n=1 Tax=Avena sativa TaxID=4498 RepID=A0ACD5YTU1_AVESA
MDAQIPATMSLSAIGIVSVVNECVTLFQWAKSALSSLHSRWNGSQEQSLQDQVLQLESGLQGLEDTLPAMYDLVNKAERRSHEQGVHKLLPNLKDAVAEAEDLLDEFRWYEKRMQVEGNASQSAFTDFFRTVIQGSFNKLNDVQLRLNHLSRQLENMGLCGVTRCFDKIVRPETTSLPNETKIFGRDKELKQLLGLLNVPTFSKRKRATSAASASTSTSTSNHVSNESGIISLPVLPIAGIGGVGKTTLAQHICSHVRVKSHFQLIIWICVSDDFDVKRLTKEVIQSCTGKDTTTDNLDALQRALSKHDSSLLRLCKYTKLRTLICKKDLKKKSCSVMGQWCSELPRMRVISCATTDELPDNIGNWKHLRYLEISKTCPLKRIPSTFCWLYHLQILYAKSCRLESLPCDFGKLISLWKLESLRLKSYDGYCMHLAPSNWSEVIRLIKNLNQFRSHLSITHVRLLSKDQAAELELENKKYLDGLNLDMREHDYICFPRYCINKEIEVLEGLQPPISLKSLFLKNYIGVSLPSWFLPQNLPSLKSLTFIGCVGLESIYMTLQIINLNEIPAVGIFSSLTDLTIDGCHMLSSLEHFLHPDYVPAIKKIRIKGCKILASIPTEKFGDLQFLEELDVINCPNMCSQRLVSSSLKKLNLHESGLFCNIDCCSLTYFDLSCKFVTSIQLDMWSLPSLWQLSIRCGDLTYISGSIRTFSSLKVLSVISGDKLSTLDDLLTQKYLPAIEEINVKYCRNLLSLPGERFGSFPYLKRLVVTVCPSLNWQRGLVLPSSLQSLRLTRCGDITPCVPSCLQNLTSLVALNMGGCNGITSIPGNIWKINLASLEELVISDCPDLVSIGGAKAVAKIKVLILTCPNLVEAEQINRRFLVRNWRHWKQDELSNSYRGKVYL